MTTYISPWQQAKEDMAAILMTRVVHAKKRAEVDVAEYRSLKAQLDQTLAEIEQISGVQASA